MERGTGLGTSSSTSSVLFFCYSFLVYRVRGGGDGGAPMRVLGGRDDSDVFPAKDIAVGAARQAEVVYRRGGDNGNGASVDFPELLNLQRGEERRGEERSEAKRSKATS